MLEKKKFACDKQFLLFPQCFQKLSVVDASEGVSVARRINICKFFSVWTRLNFCYIVFWKGVEGITEL